MATNPRIAFGTNLRRTRKTLGLSQEALAHLSGIHRTYIGSVERGERNISLENIVAIANALNIPIQELVKGVDK